jgi:uncharacterized ubiquitin-like protein YukD
METTLKVIVRIVSSNEDIDVDLPSDATAGDVIDSLLEANYCDRNDHAGNPITYQLTPKGNKGLIIGEDQTLAEAKVQQGDVLLMTPVFVAG